MEAWNGVCSTKSLRGDGPPIKKQISGIAMYHDLPFLHGSGNSNRFQRTSEATMSLTILLRIGTLLFLSVKLLTDASFPLTIQGFTVSIVLQTLGGEFKRSY